MLHMEVFMQRLEQEHGASVVTTTPTVPYWVHLPGGSQQLLESAADFSTASKARP
jgi:translation factor GUF1, mitochondrial